MMAGSNRFVHHKEARMTGIPPYVYATKKKSGLFFTLMMLFTWFKQKHHQVFESRLKNWLQKNADNDFYAVMAQLAMQYGNKKSTNKKNRCLSGEENLDKDVIRSKFARSLQA